jgi:RNA polymerase sigma-70 factor (ECF subfamily)
MHPIDPAKLGSWFDAYGGRLVLYARQWLSRQSAEDVVQDVFIRLFGQGDEPTNARAWLFRSVRNAAISAVRSERGRHRREHKVAGRQQDWFQSHAGDLLDAETAQSALTKLAENQREVIVLRIWGELTLAEVSQIVEMPISSVHECYRNGLIALRIELESSCRKTQINNP